MIGLDLPDLLTIPWSVLIAGGIEKSKQSMALYWQVF